MVIGICGGSGSGKSTVARRIVDALRERIVYLQQDNYYKDLSNIPVEARGQLNFDHPDAVDLEMMAQHARRLKEGHAIECPSYDFTCHSRRPETIRVEPRPVIIVEGILIFTSEELRRLMDIKIFVDTDADLRFLRRLQRDIAERGRTVESVERQYLDTVRPMHLQFVEPTKRYADLIIPEGGFNPVGVDLVIQKIKSMLQVSEQAARE
jgi:uridine kinase